MDIDVNGAAGGDAHRANVGGIAPRCVPFLAALGRVERFDRRHRTVREAKQMRLLGADEETARRRREARRVGTCDRRVLLPAMAIVPAPHRSTP